MNGKYALIAVLLFSSVLARGATHVDQYIKDNFVRIKRGVLIHKSGFRQEDDVKGGGRGFWSEIREVERRQWNHLLKRAANVREQNPQSKDPLTSLFDSSLGGRKKPEDLTLWSSARALSGSIPFFQFDALSEAGVVADPSWTINETQGSTLIRAEVRGFNRDWEIAGIRPVDLFSGLFCIYVVDQKAKKLRFGLFAMESPPAELRDTPLGHEPDRTVVEVARKWYLENVRVCVAGLCGNLEDAGPILQLTKSELEAISAKIESAAKTELQVVSSKRPRVVIEQVSVVRAPGFEGQSISTLSGSCLRTDLIESLVKRRKIDVVVADGLLDSLRARQNLESGGMFSQADRNAFVKLAPADGILLLNLSQRRNECRLIMTMCDLSKLTVSPDAQALGYPEGEPKSGTEVVPLSYELSSSGLAIWAEGLLAESSISNTKVSVCVLSAEQVFRHFEPLGRDNSAVLREDLLLALKGTKRFEIVATDEMQRLLRRADEQLSGSFDAELQKGVAASGADFLLATFVENRGKGKGKLTSFLVNLKTRVVVSASSTSVEFKK